MKFYSLSLKDMSLWTLAFFVIFGFSGCFSHPRMNGHPSEPIVKSDYEKDVEERIAFPRNYLKIDPRVAIRTPSATNYDEIIRFSDPQSQWDQGFVANLPNLGADARVYYYLLGVNPGDLAEDEEGNQILFRFYNDAGERFIEYTRKIDSVSNDWLNQHGDIYNHRVRGIAFFETMEGEQGYMILPPIYINIY